MRSGLALASVLMGCSFDLPADIHADGGNPSSPDACVSFSSQLDTCALAEPIPLDLSGMLVFDTDTGVLTRNGISVSVVSQALPTPGGEVRALLATLVIFQNDAQLRAQGTRGFAIVATGSITMQAGSLIDVSAGGAGHRAACPSGPTRGEADDKGAAGGGGGGFGAQGGDGGNGDLDSSQSQGGSGGLAVPSPPAGVLGGCSGAGGGDQSVANPGGNAGLGGGAVYLVSNVTIGISDTAGIQAGGGGGAGGTRTAGNGDAGGGGGGSGGMIFLEARVVRSEGTLRRQRRRRRPGLGQRRRRGRGHAGAVRRSVQRRAVRAARPTAPTAGPAGTARARPARSPR